MAKIYIRINRVLSFPPCQQQGNICQPCQRLALTLGWQVNDGDLFNLNIRTKSTSRQMGEKMAQLKIRIKCVIKPGYYLIKSN